LQAYQAQAPKVCGIIVRNARLVCMDGQRTVIPSGSVAIEGTRIVGVGTDQDVARDFVSDMVIDAGGGLVHPGFIDSHLHISQHISRGFDSLVARNPGTTVNYAAWKAELHDEEEFASTALGALDLLKHGYTGFVDGGTAFNPDVVAAAAIELGIRAWTTDPYIWDESEIMDSIPRLMSPELRARAPFGLDTSLRMLGGQLKWNREPDGLVRGYISIYGLGTASDELETAASRLAREAGVAFVQHAGYVIGMTEWIETKLARPYIVHLAGIGVLDDNAVLAHLNVAKDAEVDLVEKAGASVIWCPANYLYFAAREGLRGRMPELLHRGVRLSLCADTPKNCSVGDTGCLALHAGAESGTVLAGADILAMLTTNAGAMFRAPDVGSIEVGKRADIVVRRDAPDVQPCLDPHFQLAVLARSASVRTVLVNGKVVLDDGRSTLVDEAEIYRKVQAATDGMNGRLGLRR
jgi:cytosine/adenosine deaminase-related metal-dependent hydrolase